MRGGLAVFVLAVLGVASAAADTRDDVRAWLRAIEAACAEADAAAVAALFTEDAVVIDPQRSPLRGRAAVAASFDYSFEFGLTGLTSAADEVYGSEDTAVAIGGAAARYRDGAVARSRFMILLRKVDGRWLAHRAVTNAEP